MSRDRWRFTASEIKRAVTAVTATGLTVSNIGIGRDGNVTISVVPGTGTLPLGSPNRGSFTKTAADGEPR